MIPFDHFLLATRLCNSIQRVNYYVLPPLTFPWAGREGAPKRSGNDPKSDSGNDPGMIPPRIPKGSPRKNGNPRILAPQTRYFALISAGNPLISRFAMVWYGKYRGPGLAPRAPAQVPLPGSGGSWGMTRHDPIFGGCMRLCVIIVFARGGGSRSRGTLLLTG